MSCLLATRSKWLIKIEKQNLCFGYSYLTKCESPAGNLFPKFCRQCSIFGCIIDQWVTILSPDTTPWRELEIPEGWGVRRPKKFQRWGGLAGVSITSPVLNFWLYYWPASHNFKAWYYTMERIGNSWGVGGLKTQEIPEVRRVGWGVNKGGNWQHLSQLSMFDWPLMLWVNLLVADTIDSPRKWQVCYRCEDQGYRLMKTSWQPWLNGRFSFQMSFDLTQIYSSISAFNKHWWPMKSVGYFAQRSRLLFPLILGN